MDRYHATEFKTKCLKLLETLSPEGIVITKRGRPIARVLPIRESSLEEFYGGMKGKIIVKGDIFSTGLKWNAER